ncbi:flavodoxin family protein [Propioniciclava flava]|uniref:Flavodoxin n=1 Tax=Propioniciclava flava TaxID=2072026 RepID=A0A4Q2EN35_9ACTN|nr:flavodoxin family protein [Propioniciclava flava]RXW33485.1 flavodoxin [Propioniciclava flava]
MKAVVVVESWFGNTREIGEAVARGLTVSGVQVEVASVDEAPAAVDGDVGLLVIGAPTHNRGLSTADTRAKAAEAVHRPVGSGAREWVASAILPDDLNLAVFDTTNGRGWLSGSAAKAAARILSGRAPGRSIQTRTFVVRGMAGPLRPGEVEAAEAWGRSLATVTR